jgi:anti-sigma regulatory factor (Ser/Thr protein kinase)
MSMTNRGVLNVYNTLDTNLLGTGTAVFGNVDGGHGDSAGRTGFYRSQSMLYEIEILPEHQTILDDPHTVATNAALVADYATPWIMSEEWPPPRQQTYDAGGGGETYNGQCRTGASVADEKLNRLSARPPENPDPTMRLFPPRITVFVLLAGAVLCGCSAGPVVLSSNRAAYNEAVQRSANQQLLLNLVGNAVKFTPEDGEIKLSLSEEGEYAVMRVSDTGIGIAEEDIPHVFDRFYQAESSRANSETDSGTGLGLSICKWIAEAHRGEIKVESQLGQGTTFTIAIPKVEYTAQTQTNIQIQPEFRQMNDRNRNKDSQKVVN